MKKNSFLKVIAGLFVLFGIASWIIPTGSYTDGIFAKDVVAAFGIIDFIKYPIIALTSSVFVLYALVFLSIGGLYAVLNKTGAYQVIVEKIAKKFKKNKNKVLVATVLIFAILESLTALTLTLFILVPFAVAVLMKLGYDKKTVLLATIGSILLGNLASVYGFNVSGYLTYFYGFNISSMIVFKIIFFILTIGLLLLYLLVFNKQKNVKKTKEEVSIPLYEEVKTKNVNTKPLIIVMSILMLLSLVGMYNWFNNFGIDFFNNVYESVTTFEFAGVAIFDNLLGAIDPIGYWTNYDLVVLIVIATLVIARLYKLSIKDTFKSFVSGMQKMAPVAVLVIISNLLFLLVNSTTYSFYPTINNSITGLFSELNMFTVGISTMVGSLLYNDFPYLINSVYTNVALSANVEHMAFVQQALHGFVCLVAPTSFLLVAGLTYLKIDYKEFLKSIWKPLLVLLGFIMIMIFILGLI